ESDSVTAANDGLSVAYGVVGKPNAGFEIGPYLVPQPADWILRIGRRKDLARSGLDLDIRARTQKEVGVFGRVPIGRHTVVFPPHAQVQGQPRSYLPSILRVQRRVFITEAT